MLKVEPDPGALLIWNIKNKNQFVSAFAANDPDSTFKVWSLIKNKFNNNICVFLNTRDDRRYRTKQLIDLVANKIKPDLLVIRVDNLDIDIPSINVKVFPMKTTQNDVIDYIVNLENHTILGIGNMVGWGEVFLKQLENNKEC